MATNTMATGERMNSIKTTATMEGDKHVNTGTNTHRRAAATVGVLFILATVSAIIGLGLYGPILSGTDFLAAGFANRTQVTWGVAMELVLVFTAIGTAVGLFPFLRKYNESIA